MKKIVLIILGIIILIVAALGAHWAVWELVPPVPNKDLVDSGTFIPVNGMDIHMEQEGAGTPIILIHGYTGTYYTWRLNIHELAGDFTVYTLDLPGFGYSDKPKDFAYTLDGYADFMAAFMDAVGVDSAVLVGNSMGGIVAMSTYFKYPDRVKKLVLVDSDGYPEEGDGFFIFELMGYPVVGDVLMSFNYRGVVEQSLRSGVYYDNRFVTDDVVDSYYNVFKTENGRKGPLWVGDGVYGDVQFDAERIKTIDIPTLIIWGQDDTLIPVAQADYFARDIAGSQLVVIPEAGHLPQEEKADIVNGLITDFVKGVR